MPEHDALISSYSHLRNLPREKDALHTLKKIASLVKPIMRARGWKVRELAEFWPDQANLLGLNVNRGQKILLRLRYPGDKTQFLPIEQVTDTMLHELSHIVHGPHDGKFHALWDQLRDEYEGLRMKGYTGEGFLSEGHRLGGRAQVPMHEARRLARAAAERRRTLGQGSGQRLGGTAPRPGDNIRNVIVDAIARRNQTLQGCGNTTHNDREIEEIAATATRNGFHTQAEEDAANEAAIAQALWELVQEDEKKKYGDQYVPPSAENPAGNGGWSEVSALSGAVDRRSFSGPAARPSGPSPDLIEQKGWTCSICTLYNPAKYLCCDACGSEKKSQTPIRNTAEPSRKRPLTATATADRSRADLQQENKNFVKGQPKDVAEASPTVRVLAPKPKLWMCSFCGTNMEAKWWTCATCGKMKDTS